MVTVAVIVPVGLAQVGCVVVKLIVGSGIAKISNSKLLSKIETENNKLVLYSIYDTFFNVDDNVYIIVVDETKATPEYILLDSINTSMKYKILKKVGNRITLDIKYDEFINNYKEINNNVTDVELLQSCYISRIYLSDSEIKSGVINSSIMENIKLQPITKIYTTE